MHPEQLTITPGTVRGLIDRQFPEWRGMAVEALRTQGTVIALFRVGDGLVARFPLMPGQDVRQVGSGDLEWARGVAWAFEQAMGLVWYYADSNPAMALTGRRTLQRITEPAAA